MQEKTAMLLLLLQVLQATAAYGCVLPSYLTQLGDTDGNNSGYNSATTTKVNMFASSNSTASLGNPTRWLIRKAYSPANNNIIFTYEFHVESSSLRLVQMSHNCSDDKTICRAENPTSMLYFGCERRVTPVNMTINQFEVFELKRIGPKSSYADNYCAAFRPIANHILAYYFETIVDGLPEHRRCETILELVRGDVNSDQLRYLFSLDHVVKFSAGLSDVTCPPNLVGGFTFKSFAINKTGIAAAESVCANDTWRSSQLDSECFKGEGFEFVFPKPSCNVFDSSTTKLQLACGVGWKRNDGKSTIVWLRNVGTSFPNTDYWLMYTTSSANLNKVSATVVQIGLTCLINRSVFNDCVLTTRQRTSNSFRLLFNRRDAIRSCYDENEDCESLHSYCFTKSAHEFAEFCKRTCNRCSDDIAVEGLSPECNFHDADFQGTWYVHGDSAQAVSVHPNGIIQLSRDGDELFACKFFDQLVAPRQRYSLQKHFSNGCLPRKICYEFWQLVNANEAAPLRGITMSRQNSRSKMVTDVETLYDLCPNQAHAPLAKSAVAVPQQPQALPMATPTPAESEPFQLLLRYPLVPQKCGLYGFYLAALTNDVTDVTKNRPNLEFAIITDLNFTTCRHTDRIMMKNLFVTERSVPKSRTSGERNYRCFGKFKLHPESVDDIFIVADETVTAQYYCAIFTRMLTPRDAQASTQRNLTDLRFSGSLHLVPIQNCTFTSLGYLANPNAISQSWLTRNDVHYINNCQEDGQEMPSTSTRQFQQIYYSVRSELQDTLGITKLLNAALQKTTAAAAKRSHKSAKQDETMPQPQAVIGGGRSLTVSSVLTFLFALFNVIYFSSPLVH